MDAHTWWQGLGGAWGTIHMQLMVVRGRMGLPGVHTRTGGLRQGAPESARDRLRE